MTEGVESTMQADLSLTRRIRSRRFDLSPLGLGDASLFAELAEDTEIVKYLVGDWSTARKRLENARAWICDRHNPVIWGVYDRAGAVGTAGEIIGVCGVEQPLPGIGAGPSIFYAFRRQVWGRGVASEVAATVIDLLFDEAGVDAVEALVLPNINRASARVLEKHGMRLIGRYPMASYAGDDSLPTLRYEVWRAQVALPADARACTAEAAFKIGQFVGDGISSFDEMSAALLVSAHENGLVEQVGTDEAKRVIASALQAGMADDGWLYYRVERDSR
jgi:RimJ/RimL family protein N-acetyltransferase